MHYENFFFSYDQFITKSALKNKKNQINLVLIYKMPKNVYT